MFTWFVTLRAAEGQSAALQEILQERLLPLLKARAECERATLAGCVNCAGEYTFLGFWPDRETVELFESSPDYAGILDAIRGLVRVPPKRELWEVLAV